jgi:hypothetical protein
VISANRCERNYRDVKSHVDSMPELKSSACATLLLASLDAQHLIERSP